MIPTARLASLVCRSAATSVLVALLGPLAGCHQAATPVSAIYTVPESLDALSEETFFDHPWPSDLRLEGGSPRFTGYYNPLAIPILDTYIESMAGLLDGFSPAAAGYLRFTGDIDPGSLPATPGDALDPGAAVQLLDIDPASPEHGQRKLVSLEWHQAAGVYYLPDTLGFMPTVGFPLRPHTRYALVVTDAVQALAGGPVTQSATVAALVDEAPAFTAPVAAAQATLATAVAEIEDAGIPADQRGSPRGVHHGRSDQGAVRRARRGCPDHPGARCPSRISGCSWRRGRRCDEYQGRYGPSPNYQAGTIPFVNYGDGGQFVFQDGLPVVQSTFDLRFSLMVPNDFLCPMPPDGYPIVLYRTAPGGDYRSYVDDGTGVGAGPALHGDHGRRSDLPGHPPRLDARRDRGADRPHLLQRQQPARGAHQRPPERHRRGAAGAPLHRERLLHPRRDRDDRTPTSTSTARSS